MKSRAGAIGQGGVRDVLERIRNDRPASGPKALAIHLVGHSFGGRLVTAAVEGPEGAPPLPVSSLVLLQAAFSHYGFALAYDGTHDGFFRRVVTDPAYVTGVVAITFTAKDKAVGLAYPIASRIARQIAAALGDAGDPYGGLGRNGAQKTPGAKTVTLAVPGSAYGFVARGIYNLDSNQTIGGHSDLAHPEVAYALLSAMAAAQP
jgi:pimeloyl-ACP methyl ester carboxylesterase